MCGRRGDRLGDEAPGVVGEAVTDELTDLRSDGVDLEARRRGRLGVSTPGLTVVRVVTPLAAEGPSFLVQQYTASFADRAVEAVHAPSLRPMGRALEVARLGEPAGVWDLAQTP